MSYRNADTTTNPATSQVLPLLIMFFFTLSWYEVTHDEFFAGMNINVL